MPPVTPLTATVTGGCLVTTTPQNALQTPDCDPQVSAAVTTATPVSVARKEDELRSAETIGVKSLEVAVAFDPIAGKRSVSPTRSWYVWPESEATISRGDP